MTRAEYLTAVKKASARIGPCTLEENRYRWFAMEGYGNVSPEKMARLIPDIIRFDKYHRPADIVSIRRLFAGFPPESLWMYAHMKSSTRYFSPLSHRGKRRVRRMTETDYTLEGWRNRVPAVKRIRMSSSAMAVLGRMPRYLAEAAVLDAARRGERRLTPSTVDWTYVAHVRDQVASFTRAAEAWGTSLGVLTATREIAYWLTPQFNNVYAYETLLLARGFTPVEVAAMFDVTVTAAEAHEYFTTISCRGIAAFIIRKHLDGIPLWGFMPRSVAVARWLRAVWDRGGRDAIRKAGWIGPAPTDRLDQLVPLDEVMDEDLVRGSATGVRAVVAAARARINTTDAGRYDETPLAAVPAGWVLPPAVTPLLSRADLTREGYEMGHCVQFYHTAVSRGQCVIFSIRAGESRSTLELGPDGSIHQHRGPGNGKPDPACIVIADAMVASIRKMSV